MLLKRAFALYHDPPHLQATIVEHLRWMWHEVLEEEWLHIRPLLDECVAAFERMDFSNMTANEAIRSLSSPGVRGVFPADQALRQLLTNTGATYRFIADGSVIIELQAVATEAAAFPPQRSPLRPRKADTL